MKLMVASQRDWSRHNYRVGEDTLLYQTLMDQEPEQYALDKQKRLDQKLNGKNMISGRGGQQSSRGTGLTEQAPSIPEATKTSSASVIQIDK